MEEMTANRRNITDEAATIASSLDEDGRDMVMAASDDLFHPAVHLASGRHGQAFTHFNRRNPGLFERRFDPSASTYRRTDLCRQVRMILLSPETDS